MLRLAVYGTLRRGGPNHDRFMRGYRSVEEITLRGRLRWLTATIPILEVPAEDIVAVGSADPLADMRLAERLQRESLGEARPAVAGTWDEVPAELFTFDDPETRLPPLDRLEGFRPGVRSLYRRVLLGRPWGCWVYVEGDGRGE
ncbi:MAG: gamma-glutamylcyclotransferase family protein [Candidatus Sumerlaeia bacterium]|nr:gamma-glutamylcyclotransferase family protein [Candidatus Sumerlaeia bacterium]